MIPQRIIVLKGNPNFGKDGCLFNYLPVLLNQLIGKRVVFYRGLSILIIRRSIHESYDWKTVIAKIINCNYDIIVIPAWADTFISESSSYVKRKLEDMIEQKAKDKFIFKIVEMRTFDAEADQMEEQKKCATRVKEYIDAIEQAVESKQ